MSNTVSFLEHQFPTGTLKISLVKDGVTTPYFEEENLIVLLSRQNILASLYLPNRVSDPINTLKVGTGGSIDPQGLFPKAVDKSMASLFNPILTTSTTYTVDNSLPTVTFIADVAENEAAGQLINEAGLFTTSGNLFNIKTFPAIPKTNEFGIHIEWTIDFS